MESHERSTIPRGRTDVLLPIKELAPNLFADRESSWTMNSANPRSKQKSQRRCIKSELIQEKRVSNTQPFLLRKHAVCSRKMNLL